MIKPSLPIRTSLRRPWPMRGKRDGAALVGDPVLHEQMASVHLDTDGRDVDESINNWHPGEAEPAENVASRLLR